VRKISLSLELARIGPFQGMQPTTRGGRPPPKIELVQSEREDLERWARGRTFGEALAPLRNRLLSHPDLLRHVATCLSLSAGEYDPRANHKLMRPHRQDTFTLSTDDFSVEKVRDVVGLYMHPPDHAVVLCVDEKSQVQALERKQPVLPMVFGQPERTTPQYLRHGTTTLFAALDIATGQVIGECHKRHRAVEFRSFLNTINKSVPADLDVHVVMDNYATHSAPEIKRWLARHPRFHFHFTPTYSSCLNQVERWFALLTERSLRRGVHRSTKELEQAIREFLDANVADSLVA
jgi:transposase